jgi:hypothetical protein
MSELLKINVNEHTERKNGLTYLSWAWAWAEVLKIDAKARWHAVEFGNERGCALPCMFLPDGSAMVKVEVTIKGETKTCLLPVMNHRNQAIKNPDSFAVNTAIMRCLAKAISMHGLGLYIYAGEDLPEGEEVAGNESSKGEKVRSFRSSATMNEDGKAAIDLLPEDERAYIRELAAETAALVASQQPDQAWHRVEGEHLEVEQKMALWSILDSKTRAAIKRAGQTLKEAA